MFEKEAEEYANKNVPTGDFGYRSLDDVRYDVKQAYRAGAEFGYSKVNEWHFVKDEGTPKVEGHYLVCLRNKDMDIFDCWIYYDKDVGWYSMKVRIKDIYAWKEIIYPELKEN